MAFDIERLDQPSAYSIANEWKYPDVYSFYDMTSDPEDYEEIMDPLLRAENYFQVLKDDRLFGFFVVEKNPDHNVMNMGLGIRPELTGKGLGQAFVSEIITYIHKNYSVKMLRLGVAAFNKRAQKVYEKIGFKQTKMYDQETNGSIYPFIEMEIKL